MNLKNLLLVNAIVALFFGVVFVLLPEDALAQYGVKLMPKAGIFVARLFGATLLGVAIISWFARTMSADARSGVVLGFIVIDGVGFIVSLLAQIDGVVNELGWSTVVIYLLLGLGFIYFRFMKPGG
ncbi:MAG: hypothetical protein JSW54_10410 [Fidelibacterota bacterium]|nr:MAG: hypothetical protein JSW54_10410 [Candidatus Neomarinimicrobiota bacterium]